MSGVYTYDNYEPSITTQTGIYNVSNTYADANLFTGIIEVDRANISNWAPRISGYGIFQWITGPNFMTNTTYVSESIRSMWTRFDNLTSKGAVSFNGLQDLSMETASITGGFAGNTIKVAQNTKIEMDTFTLKVYEQQGSPYREAIDYWFTGIRDEGTGLLTLKGQVENMDPVPANYTATALYIVTDPSRTRIESAYYLTNIFPTKSPMSQDNGEFTSHSPVEYDLEFSCFPYRGVYINQYAQQALTYYKTLANSQLFLPGSTDDLTTAFSATDASSTTNTSTGTTTGQA